MVAGDFGGAKRLALGAAALGIGLLAAGFFVDRAQLSRSYLLGFEMFLSLSLGALVVVMLHHSTAGAWGFVIRRVLESAMANLPILALLFLPIAFSLPDLYPWARPDEVAHHPILLHKSRYLNPEFFRIRALIYFAIWSGFALLLRKWSLDQDRANGANASRALSERMGALSGPGLVIHAFTVTFASVDFVMSLEPEWFSTIYALLMVVIQALSALAFGTAFAALAKGAAPLRTGEAANHFHDLGNLMLAFVMLWAYMMLSQYLIIWAGNLPEEIPWYLTRTRDSWGSFTRLLVAGHFALPFVFLLFRANKRDLRALARLACFLLVMVAVDFVWFISPAFYPEGLHFHWLDLAAVLGIGGLWFYLFVARLEKSPLLPIQDPTLPRVFLATREVPNT